MERVLLRDVIDADVRLFFEQQRDPAYNHMAAFTRKDPSDWAAFAAHHAKICADPTVVMRTILYEGRVAGNVASFVMFGEREVTYGIARELWGRGLATAALRLFLADLKERPLFARAAEDNGGSLRVLEKCGFVVCGHDRGFASARGQEVDEVVLKLV